MDHSTIDPLSMFGRAEPELRASSTWQPHEAELKLSPTDPR
jgi:hypothetical protein